MSERESERKEAWSGLQGGCAPIGRGSRDAGIDSRDKGDLSFHSLSGGFGGMQMTKVEFGEGNDKNNGQEWRFQSVGGTSRTGGCPGRRDRPPAPMFPKVPRTFQGRCNGGASVQESAAHPHRRSETARLRRPAVGVVPV